MKLDESKHPLGTITGKLKCTPAEAWENWGFAMRTDCTAILFRSYTYLNANGKKKKGTFISNFRKPTNPQTETQQGNRRLMKLANKQWKELSAGAKEDYRKRALRLGISGFNLHNSEFIKANK